MFDADGFRDYLRQKISLENKLIETGKVPLSTEVKSQLVCTEERLLARIKQAYYHANQELTALKMMLIASETQVE